MKEQLLTCYQRIAPGAVGGPISISDDTGGGLTEAAPAAPNWTRPYTFCNIRSTAEKAMLLHPRSKNRSFHLGPFPLESLPRDESIILVETGRIAISSGLSTIQPSNDALSRACDHYGKIFSKFAEGAPAASKAPVPDDLERRSVDIKGGAYFMDASCVGICRIPAKCLDSRLSEAAAHFAVVIMVEHPRRAETSNLAHEWTEISRRGHRRCADLRNRVLSCRVHSAPGFQCAGPRCRRSTAGARAACRPLRPCRTSRCTS